MRHSDMINSIVEIERQARDMTAQAQARRELLDQQVEQQTEQMRQRFHQQAEGRIAQARRQEEARQAESMRELEQRLQAALADLERKSRDNHRAWVQALFDRIVGESSPEQGGQG